MKKLLQKFIPPRLILIYHKLLAIAANILYRFPSQHLTVIGVTGTNGKTTTCNLLWEIFTAAGFKTGLATTINFKIGSREWPNRTKQGMQGRFKLQKLLRHMVKEGCTHAIIETTSEGVKQFRHFGILYDTAVFTNLTPEHIEAHGSFENYKKAKGELFKTLKHHSQLMRLIDRKGNAKTAIINSDDSHADYFLQFSADEKWVYTIQKKVTDKITTRLSVKEYHLSSHGSTFSAELSNHEYPFKTKLLGLFNIYNSAAAIATALSRKIRIETIQEALEKAKPIPGRMEVIPDSKRGITFIVDYAHDPAALESVYETIAMLKDKNHLSKIIAVLGAVGGGRDTAKRPLLGALASKYAADVIITNEDPYDDDPLAIINQIEAGVKKDPTRELNKNYWKILDRREAIQKAVELAKIGDIVALTGKGAEEVMAVKGGLVPWDDRVVVKEVLAL